MHKFLNIVLGFGSWVLRAFVVTMLWSWFVVPTFGAPALPLVAALGISMIHTVWIGRLNWQEVNFLINQPDDEKLYLTTARHGAWIFIALWGWLMGWLISLI